MPNNKYDSFGEQIRNTVDDAIRNNDFSNLSRSVGDIINDVIDSVRGTRPDPNRVHQQWESPYRQPSGYAGRQGQPAARTAQKPQQELYEKYPPGKTAGILMAAGGFTGTAVFGLLTLVFAIVGLASSVVAAPGVIVFGVLALLSLWLGVKGVGKIGFLSRYRKYVRIVKNQIYIPVRTLAQQVGRPVDVTMRDLKKLIDQKLLFHAHLDENEQYLVMTDEAWQEYMKAKMDVVTRQEEAKAAKEAEDGLPEECRKLIRQGSDYITFIHLANDKIPDEQISEKLYRMEKVITRIFDVVRERPAVAPDLDKLMSYYLPTTKKLLNAYMELDKQPIEGQNIASTKAEIGATIDTLNTAFEKLLDGLFEDKAWDISSDISVLNTVLAQDGLKEDELHAQMQAQGQVLQQK